MAVLPSTNEARCSHRPSESKVQHRFGVVHSTTAEGAPRSDVKASRELLLILSLSNSANNASHDLRRRRRGAVVGGLSSARSKN